MPTKEHYNRDRCIKLDKRGLISIQTSAIFLRIILIAMALVIPPALVSIFLADNINTLELQSDLLTSKILFSPEGLGWSDLAAQKSPLGIIDADKLAAASKDEKYLGARIAYTGQNLAARITIRDITAYYNKGLYEDYSVLAQTRLSGKGGADRVERTLPVLVRDGRHDRIATADIEVISPR